MLGLFNLLSIATCGFALQLQTGFALVLPDTLRAPPSTVSVDNEALGGAQNLSAEYQQYQEARVGDEEYYEEEGASQQY
ncbi:hypothetical protein B0H11DRAFT_2253272 [Mycena galericulata]|nr:hypothetical protein B0H11DRAFT_2253272 [Mycena galericulata]